MKPVLIVDDEAHMAEALSEAVKRCGLLPTVMNSPIDALLKLNLLDYSLILTDMKMPKMDGLEFLKEVRKRGVFVPVIVITGYGTVENAVDAMKLGAADYLMKPFSFDALKKVIERIMPSEDTDLVAAAPLMKKLVSMVKEVAPSDITVLLTGESGTGKEVIARYIHKYSMRSSGAFIAINCAAISESLLESELFGHEKGAFTGASDRRIGKFELANKGTLLLDEISEMAFQLQAKLLRAIQEREIDRIGGKAPVLVDTRIIATTNKNLLQEVKAGRFREDLFYRLNVFPIRIPTLRERKDDIIPLAEFFISKLAAKMGRGYSISDEFRNYLLQRQWNGNVRELENFIYRTVVIAKSDTLVPPDDDFEHNPDEPRELTGSTVKDMERELILNTLEETGWNKTKAAEKLGLSARTIRNKLKEYNLDKKDV
ncbi:MAG: sigma-54 dependent transcriptional regulator [Dissulfurispiraceae bacterium]|jgi:two-component system response regulator FlrC|nr:sigma-54 dependent transcriptional regulator [Dissulfurispiraceae bacterium]